jgi:RNA-directed DNA polymerase
VDVSQTQTKLSQWADQDRTHRFYDLYHLLYDDDWLRTAHGHVKRNAGSRTAGCDGVTMKDFDKDLEGNLKRLQEALKAERFEPHPVRRKYIQETKADGRIKMRPLGIPDICDRIVQEGLRMILEPIWEGDFSRHSYGFRPSRCTMDAVGYICLRLTGPSSQRYGWGIEGDIQSFFDSIDHQKLMALLRKRMKDQKILTLIWGFLRAGVMEQGNLRHSVLGTPQGGIVSPLLANIYLHELDRYRERYTELPSHRRQARRRQGLANFLYVRYADDFVVLCDGTKVQAMEMRQELHQFLKADLKLELSLEKTRVTHIHEGIEFLGYAIDRNISGRGKWAPRWRIPAQAKAKIRSKLRTALDPSTCSDSMRTKIIGLNRVIGGWCRYYQVTSSPSRCFNMLSHEVYWKMIHWIGRKYQLSTPQVMRQFKRENTFGIGRLILKMPWEFKAKIHRIKAYANPYVTPPSQIQRENLDSLEAWTGMEERKGQEDRKEVVYERDKGICGLCGKPVKWKEAILDHKIPRHRFQPVENADVLDNLWILHIEPCNRWKTKRDLQGESRVR